MTIVVHKVLWNNKGWRGFDKEEWEKNIKKKIDEKPKASNSFWTIFGYGHEWWNFREDFDEEHYYGYFYTGDGEPKIEPPITVLFVSRKKDKEWYLIGAYINADFNKSGFSTNKKIIELIPDECIKRIEEKVQEYKKIFPEEKDYPRYWDNVKKGQLFKLELRVAKNNAILLKKPIKIKYKIGRPFRRNMVMYTPEKLKEHSKFFEEIVEKLNKIEDKNDAVKQLIKIIKEEVLEPEDIKKGEEKIKKKTQDPLHEQIEKLLKRKGAVILYGPPGTGKTFTVIEFLKKKGDRYEIITFHQNYDYSDFVIGIKPEEEGGNLIYKTKKGILLQLAEEASKHPDKNYYLLIDEINRGDISRIFGELITVIEKDKRDEKITLPNGKKFKLPENLFIIGTMNSTDRSIALIDYALRRRFAFIRMSTDYNLIEEKLKEKIGKDKAKIITDFLRKLNEKIREHKGIDFEIGHSFFLNIEDPNDLTDVWNYEIIPLLEEYFYLEKDTIKDILKDFCDENGELKTFSNSKELIELMKSYASK